MRLPFPGRSCEYESREDRTCQPGEMRFRGRVREKGVHSFPLTAYNRFSKFVRLWNESELSAAGGASLYARYYPLGSAWS